ncbi:hypothetical protein CBS101457_001805 [Exobasidium rhododendri]|nr:hypothetical protein CBS101457_001805 [Exobasidium rhododendri]
MGLLADLFHDKTPTGEQRYPFWHNSFKQQRKQWFKLEIIAFCAITVSIFTLLPLYYGSYYKQEQNAYRLTVRIIDLDSQASPIGSTNAALLSPAVQEAIESNIAAQPGFHLGWQFEDDLGRFALTGYGVPTDVSPRGIDADEYASQLVLDQTVFGAVVIHANATSAATQAYQQGSANYSSSGAMSFYYEEARNFYSTNQYVAFYTTQVLSAAGNMAGVQFAARQLTAATTGTTPNFTALSTAISPPTGVMGYSSSLLTQPFYYSQFNLRPFDQLIGTAATTVGQVYLIIFTFYVGLGFKQAMDPIAHKMTLGSEILVRLSVPFVGYLWISLMYSLVSLAFLVDMSRKYGKGGFPLYWCMNFVTMTGLGYVMELVLLAFGSMVFPFFLLFWVIINVSVAFLDIADEDHFYSYGFVLPVYNSVDTAKSIFYGTKNRLGKDFAINLAWVVFGVVGISLVAIHQRNKAEKKADKEEMEKREKGEKPHSE